jgi:HAD superfamily hydrolase (TIGR01490 family)
MIAAVFDLDRTLLPSTTAERLFVRYLIERRVLGLRALVETARFSLTTGLRDPIRLVKENRPYFRGLHVARMWLLGRRCFEDVIRGRLSKRGLDQLELHRRAGHRIVLLSGSIPFVVQPMARTFAVDHVICSQLDVRDQRLTGRIVDLHPYGKAKAELMRRYAGAVSLDLARSYCYADHHTDVGILRLFGNPVCVNPTEQLRITATRAGWSIVEFD